MSAVIPNLDPKNTDVLFASFGYKTEQHDIATTKSFITKIAPLAQRFDFTVNPDNGKELQTLCRKFNHVLPPTVWPFYRGYLGRHEEFLNYAPLFVHGTAIAFFSYSIHKANDPRYLDD